MKNKAKKTKKSKTIGRKKQRDSRHLMWGNPHTAQAIEPTGWGYHTMLQQYEHKLAERDRMDKVKAVQQEDKQHKFVYDHAIKQGVAKAKARNERVKAEGERIALAAKTEHDMKELNHAHNVEMGELRSEMERKMYNMAGTAVNPNEFRRFHTDLNVEMKADDEFPDEGFTLPEMDIDATERRFVMVPDQPTRTSRIHRRLVPENANDLIPSLLGHKRGHEEPQRDESAQLRRIHGLSHGVRIE